MPASTEVTSTSPADTQHWERAFVESEHDRLAAQLEQVGSTRTIQDSIELAVQLMRIPPGGRALDLGCGTGAALAAMARAIGDGTLAGLDHSPSFLADSRARSVSEGFSDQLVMIQGDAHHLPFPDDTFDAAHTERVLMHLENPRLALRELRRVVRPGGWIVCVEPDLAGMRVDLDAMEHGAAIIRGFCSTLRNPEMGLQLNRRMALAGLIERSVDALTETLHEFPEDVAGIFANSAQIAIDRGWLTADDAAAALSALAFAAENGTYTSYASMFVVAGRVPGAS